MWAESSTWTQFSLLFNFKISNSYSKNFKFEIGNSQSPTNINPIKWLIKAFLKSKGEIEFL